MRNLIYFPATTPVEKLNREEQAGIVTYTGEPDEGPLEVISEFKNNTMKMIENITRVVDGFLEKHNVTQDTVETTQDDGNRISLIHLAFGTPDGQLFVTGACVTGKEKSNISCCERVKKVYMPL